MGAIPRSVTCVQLLSGSTSGEVSLYELYIENQMEKKLENDMETGMMEGFIGILRESLNSLKGFVSGMM